MNEGVACCNVELVAQRWDGNNTGFAGKTPAQTWEKP
jgi:hypothetical protein